MIKWTVFSLLIFTSFTAFLGSYFLIISPTGEAMHLKTDILSHTPFTDFLIPGIILAVVNGMGCLIASIIVLIDHPFSGSLILLQGILLSGWIISQTVLLREFHWLHTTYLSVGVLLSILGYLYNKG